MHTTQSDQYTASWSYLMYKMRAHQDFTVIYMSNDVLASLTTYYID